LDPRHNYFVFGDELDELDSFNAKLKTKTLVVEVKNLRSPRLVGSYEAPDTKATDHNQYIIGQNIYQANYRAGLRILRVNQMASANFTEVGYFDIFPQDDGTGFNGAWGVYPFFPSGNILVSGIEQGLYLLKPRDLKPTTTVSFACSVKYICRRPTDFLPARYTMHTISSETNACISRCIGESSSEWRKRVGWKCGGCP
jgi:hypothetical protein